MTSSTAASELTLVFEPIPSAVLEELRTTGVDEAGNTLTVETDADGGNPLRCCLRETRPA
jgi:hypothetical protein